MTRRFSFYAAIAFLLLRLSVAGAQTSEEGIPLAFNMSTNHPKPDSFVLGEPVLLYLHLSNFSTKPMRLEVNPTLQAGLRVEVRTPVTRGWGEVQKPTDKVPFQPSTFTLMPFDTHTFTVMLLYDRENRPIMVRETQEGKKIPLSLPKLVFDQPSPFRIKATLTVTWNGVQRLDMESGTEIDVKAPEPNSPEDLILGRLVISKKLMEAYQNLVAPEPTTRDFFEKALTDFPPNRFTPYFMYILGNSYSIRKPEERIKAEDIMLRLLQTYPDFPLRRQAAEDLALIYNETQQSDKANDIVRQLVMQDSRQGIGNFRLGRIYLQRANSMDYGPEFWMLTQ